jgi:hypothetical protein
MKTEVWIYDANGAVHDGWLELTEEAGQLRPADRGWNIIAVFPASAEAGTTRVVLWADQRDKYFARLDLGDLHRWIICERLPALLRALPALESLVRLGGA